MEKKIRRILGTKKEVMMNRSNLFVMLMEPITEKDEELIDKSKEVDFPTELFKNRKGIEISPKNIFLYGEVNIDNKDDIALINKHDIITLEIFGASNMPADFNYETGIITSDEYGTFKTTDTWNKLKWFKYKYCLLGKPNRVVLYKIPNDLYKKYYIPNIK
mgnify:CR=1 FL=1